MAAGRRQFRIQTPRSSTYTTAGGTANLEWNTDFGPEASDRQQASIVFDVEVDMVDQCPTLKKRIKPSHVREASGI